MRKIFVFFLMIAFILHNSQVINYKDYSSGKNSSENFRTAINAIKKQFSAKKQHVVLFIPSGTYTLTEPIILNKYISIEGEFQNSTILKVNAPTHEAIIIEDNRGETDLLNNYNVIRNLTILGPDFSKNPFEWKDVKRNNPKSVGVKILGLRNRIENCTIDGFLWSGIEISSSYYNFITGSFIKNNRIGITIDNNSTSAYINNNELRTNAIALLIQNNSYANFVNNNMIENNLGNMLYAAKDDNDESIYTTGNGIIINNAMNNFITNNYFEQQYTNVFLHNSWDNEISSNFIAVNNLNNKDQAVLKLSGTSNGNVFTQNLTMGPNASIDLTRILISPLHNYSSNIVDFGKAKNEKLRAKLKNVKNAAQLPHIP